MSDPRLRVALNMLWLRPGEVGGTETYATRVVDALVHAHAPDADSGELELELHTFCTTRAAEAHPGTIGATTVHTPPVGAARPSGRVAIERTWLPRQNVGVDLWHHLGGTVPRTVRGPVVVTIHDLQPLDDPANFSAVKRRWLSLAIPAAIGRARIVVTPSDWVSSTIVDRFGVDPERLATVSAYARPTETEPERTPLVRSLADRGPVLLYPAMTMAHKNHRMLFDAFARAARPDVQLVCVGSVGRDHSDVLAAASDASSRIHVLGHVAAADLAAFFHAAEAMVFPSKYEGFGLPILEAQHAGLPVIAANSTAIPEVTGGAAVLIDPDDTDGWTDALRTPLAGRQRDELVGRGLANASRYTAENTARSQLDAYRTALATS